MASAALDRLLHRGTVVNICGESFPLKEKRQAARSTLAQPAISNLSLTPEGVPGRAHKHNQSAAITETTN